MHVLRTRSWPWFALALAVFLVAVLGRVLRVLSPAAAGIVGFFAAMILIGACIRALHDSVDDVKDMEKIGMGIGFWD